MRQGLSFQGMSVQLRSLCFVTRRGQSRMVRLEPAPGVLCDTVVPAAVKGDF